MKPLNPFVNLAHHQQDVYGVRQALPELNRYRLAESLLPQNGQRMHVLEIGGGMAEFSQRLAEMGYKVTFTDLNPNSVDHAKRLGFESYHIDFNLGLPGLDESKFDVAIMLEVIEHVVNAEYLLTEARRVLKPGGVLVLSTPNFAWWSNRLRILCGQLSHDEGYHYRFFTRRSLEQKLWTARFSPEMWKFSSPLLASTKYDA